MTVTRLSPSADQVPEAPISLWGEAMRRLRQNRLALVGFGYIAFVTLLCYIGPFLYPNNPDDQVLALDSTLPFNSVDLIEVRFDQAKATPDEVTTFEDFVEVYALNPEQDLASLRSAGSLELNGVFFHKIQRIHPLGTDTKGRDLLARIMRGGRISIGVGLLATFTAILIGVSVGSVSGYFGGRIDVVLMRIVDILYALPFFIFVVLLMLLFENFEYKILLVFLAIGAVEWLTMARIVRGQVMHLKEQEFVSAARATGVPTSSIILKHLIPNLLGPVIVYATLMVPAVMLLESTLSFLGLGLSANMASWGTLIQEGQEVVRSAPWVLIAPSLFFSCTLFAMNFLGDGLRDALDVKANA